MPRKKGEGSYQKLPNGTFEFSIELDRNIYGKRVRKRFYGETEKECRKKYKQFLKDGEPKTATQGYTLTSWLDKWLETYKKGKVLEGTYSDYAALAVHVKKHKIGGLKLSQVKPIHVTDYFTDKNNYSYSFLKRMRFLLNAAFESAIDNEYCDKNPVRRAEIPKKVQPEREAFTEEQTKTIVEFAKTDKLFGLAVYIMFNTGVRSQEMRSLTTGKFDFTKGIVTIDSAIKRNGVLGLMGHHSTDVTDKYPHVSDVATLSEAVDKYNLLGGMSE
jgi:site-specific recombinase XerD